MPAKVEVNRIETLFYYKLLPLILIPQYKNDTLEEISNVYGAQSLVASIDVIKENFRIMKSQLIKLY